MSSKDLLAGHCHASSSQRYANAMSTNPLSTRVEHPESGSWHTQAADVLTVCLDVTIRSRQASRAPSATGRRGGRAVRAFRRGTDLSPVVSKRGESLPAGHRGRCNAPGTASSGRIRWTRSPTTARRKASGCTSTRRTAASRSSPSRARECCAASSAPIPSAWTRTSGSSSRTRRAACSSRTSGSGLVSKLVGGHRRQCRTGNRPCPCVEV